MDQPIATVHSHLFLQPLVKPEPGHPQTRPPLPEEPLYLAALARQGSADAHEALVTCCKQGPPARRVAALRLLPALVPFQPVWRILDQAGHPSEPAVVQKAVSQVRALIGDPRDCEPIYRSVQQSLVSAFVLSERNRLRRRPKGRRPLFHPPGSPLSRGLGAYLRDARSVTQGFYDYRFECADGCVGDPQQRHVEEFMLEYAPRRLLLHPEARRHTPELMSRHFGWLGAVGRLLPQAVETLCHSAFALSRRYLSAASEPQPGSARAMLRAAQRAGVPLTDVRALYRHVTLQSLDIHDEFAPVWQEDA